MEQRSTIIKLLGVFLFFLLIACNSENANDCLQKAGPLVREEITVDAFDKILVNRDIELIVKEGAEQRVVIETGTNLRGDVDAMVFDGQLRLTDRNTCNFIRDYGVTKVYITSPNITEIRSSTQYDIRSDGVLTYPSLTLFSEDYNAPDTFTNADFKLQIDNGTLSLVFNNLSNAFISGRTNNLSVVFAAGTSRFEGRDLVAQKVTFWNRSANDMILNPQESLKGTISGTGNVISVNQPPVVEVEELYKGELIFE